MNIRELLQTELWSKRTTRKILVWSGLVFVVGFLALKGWDFAEVHWLTRGERIAAKAALAEIDALQNAGPLTDEEFQVRLKAAEAKVKLAEGAAETYRDNFIQMKLGLCLVGVVMDRTKSRRQELIQQGRLPAERSSSEEHKRIESVLSTMAAKDRDSLHKDLD